MNRVKKAPFEATNYMLYYFAADADDAVGKACDHVLDRTKMWENTLIPGCKTAYDFGSLPESVLSMRNLPCVCSFCCADRYHQCTNTDIVGRFQDIPVSRVAEAECPPTLQEPIEGNRAYTIGVLKAFLRQYEPAVRLPANLRRLALVKMIRDRLPIHVLPAVDHVE